RNDRGCVLRQVAAPNRQAPDRSLRRRRATARAWAPQAGARHGSPEPLRKTGLRGRDRRPATPDDRARRRGSPPFAILLAAPRPPLGRIEDTIVIDVDSIELRGRPPCGSFVGAVDILVAGDPAGG